MSYDKPPPPDPKDLPAGRFGLWLYQMWDYVARNRLGAANAIAGSNPIVIGTGSSGTFTVGHAASGAAAGTYGNSTAVAQVVLNTGGHVTSGASVAISFPTQRVLEGTPAVYVTTYTNSYLIGHTTSSVAAGIYGGTLGIPRFGVNAQGHINAAANHVLQALTPIVIPTNPGTWAFTHNTSGVVGGTYGGTNLIQQLVINSFGHVQVASNVGTLGPMAFAIPGLVYSGDVIGTATTGTVTMALSTTGVTAGTYGGPLGIPRYGVNAAGRITYGTSYGGSSAREILGLGYTTLPQVNYGGFWLGGTSEYLDTNPLTGIADGKKGTFFAVVNFTNASGVVEALLANGNGNFFRVNRHSDGNLRILGENSAGTAILSIITTFSPLGSPGTYVILASFDLGTAGSAKMYVNDVEQGITETTFTDDTLDYTRTEWSVGATVTGGSKVAGNIYSLWFDPTQALDLDDESVRRRFVDSNLCPVFLGNNGELPTSSPPVLFLGYDSAAAWAANRGTGVGTFTVRGTAASPSTTVRGQYHLNEWQLNRFSLEGGTRSVPSGYEIVIGNDYSVGSGGVLDIQGRMHIL